MIERETNALPHIQQTEAMSSAGSRVYTFDGELVAYGVYSGTSDVLGPNLAESDEAAWDYEKRGVPRPDGKNAWDVLSECKHTPEKGYIYSSYGGGFYWPGEFCRECMVVHGPLAPWEVLEGSDAPEGWMGNWPKDGEPPIEGKLTPRELPSG